MRQDVGAAVATTLLLSSAAVGAAAADCSTAARCEGPDRWGLAEAESEQMQSELVQTRAHILGSRSGGPSASQPAGGVDSTARATGLFHSMAGAGLSVEQRASLLLPLAWFHVPKTGSSIINTFYHTPAICPTFSADDYFPGAGLQYSQSWDASWGDREEVCAGGFSNSYFSPTFTDDEGKSYHHAGIGGLTASLYKLNRGHFVTMLRQPEQRLISAYYYYKPTSLYPGSSDTTPPSLREYAEWSSGCVVRQLTTDALQPCDTLPLPTPEDVSVAIDMLREGFAFVGVTEQWTLSVCLFRVMFGGQCVTSDVANTRQGTNSSSSAYDTSELYGWVDALDGPVYAEALQMFEHSLNAYGADPDMCTSFCQA